MFGRIGALATHKQLYVDPVTRPCYFECSCLEVRISQPEHDADKVVFLCLLISVRLETVNKQEQNDEIVAKCF